MGGLTFQSLSEQTMFYFLFDPDTILIKIDKNTVVKTEIDEDGVRVGIARTSRKVKLEENGSAVMSW